VPESPQRTHWASWVDERTLLLVYPTNHALMAAEAVLKAGRVRSRLTPKPRGVGDDCSFALALSLSEEGRALDLLAREGWPPHAVGTSGKDFSWIPRK